MSYTVPPGGIFDLGTSQDAAAVHLLSVPWEATVSYQSGTADGPAAMLQASAQQDLYDADYPDTASRGVFLLPENPQIRRWNDEARAVVERIQKTRRPEPSQLKVVNDLGRRLNEWVYTGTQKIFESGKIPGIIGGDHSVPYGAIRAASEKVKGLGILHFDAHFDLREAYQGFEFSHASIMNNVMRSLPDVSRLVAVGIRDFCVEELELARSLGDRMRFFTDVEMHRRKFQGHAFAKLAGEIVAGLPRDVWVSFDIDGMDPRYCPHTGTAVPGGLDFNEVLEILRQLVASGKKIVGFDLNEVAPSQDPGDEWDANVGMRVLFKLCGAAIATNGS